MKKLFSLAICIMAILFAGCEPDDPVPSNKEVGVFSVSDTTTITFSPGNLQYTQSTNTWSFAENQWDYIGTDNVTGGSFNDRGDKYGDALADKIDLFGWSTSATNFGVSASYYSSDYSGSFVDWGTNKIGNDAPNTWRTLTYDEWYYVVNRRPNAGYLRSCAQVNGVNGLILLPDNWKCPAGVIFKSGFCSSSTETYAAYQTFTTDQWAKLESAGAVFLPAAGYRVSSIAFNLPDMGYYWTTTNEYYGDVYHIYFYNIGVDNFCYVRYWGLSVRLVKDL